MAAIYTNALSMSSENDEDSQQAAKPSPSQPRKLTLFALIIAIDQYAHPDIPHLSACNADAEDVIDFLKEQVGVPDERIKRLSDKSATGKAIRDSIMQLALDDRIVENDPILIYFAGHGTTVTAPQEWPAPKGLIRMLVPYDFLQKSVEDGRCVGGVLDMEISHLLGYISRKKGRNITVVLDSSYSSMATRAQGSKNSPTSTRGISPPQLYSLSATALQTILGDLYALTGTHPITTSHQGQNDSHPHVLLSSCSEDEVAKEKGGRGVFTAALFELLRKRGFAETFCQGLINALPPLPNQTPRCEDSTNFRLIFQPPPSEPTRQAFRTSINAGSLYIMDAGLSDGIREHAQFEIYADQSTTGKPLGTLEALTVAPFETRLVLPDGALFFELPNPGYAIESRAGHDAGVRLLFDLDPLLIDATLQTIEWMHRHYPMSRGIWVVNDQAQKPDLIVRSHGQVVEFEIMDGLCRQYGLTRIPHDSIKFGWDLCCALFGIAEFYWRLQFRPQSLSIKPLVVIESFKVTMMGRRNGRFPIFQADEAAGNVIQDGKIMVDLDEGAWYGFKITNKSDRTLFFSMLYFNISDLTINPFYVLTSPQDGASTNSIEPGSFLTIGYGASNHPPLHAAVGPNQTVDVGYLKVFISTYFTDYSSFTQESPFIETRSSELNLEDAGARESALSLFDTVTIAIIEQKRPHV